MNEILRNWRALRSFTGTSGQLMLERVTRLYIVAFICFVIAAILMVGTATFANYIGWKGFAFWIGLVFLVVWAFARFYPALLLLVFGVGTINGLPKDWSLNKLISERELPDLSLSNMAKAGLSLIRTFARYLEHGALFVTVFLTVLGSWDIENPKVVVPSLVILSGIGLWSSLWPPARAWYRNVVVAIFVVALGQQLYDGYVSIGSQRVIAAEAKEVGQAAYRAGKGFVDSKMNPTSIAPRAMTDAERERACLRQGIGGRYCARR